MPQGSWARRLVTKETQAMLSMSESKEDVRCVEMSWLLESRRCSRLVMAQPVLSSTS